ncbi:MAG: OsmC family protein [Campylobacterales bacterium]
MTMELIHQGGKQFIANGANGSITIDAAIFSPVEHFAAGLLACSGVDVAMMAEKQGHSLSSFKMVADIERNDDNPRFFRSAHLIYELTTDADETTAKRWVLASIETYCSTINTIRDCVELTFSVICNGHQIVHHEPIRPLRHTGADLNGFDGASCCPG